MTFHLLCHPSSFVTPAVLAVPIRAWLSAIGLDKRLVVHGPPERLAVSFHRDKGVPVAVRLLTTEEVAARFRTSPATVRYWRHAGIGPAGVRVGRRVLYEETECDRWWQDKVARALNEHR